MSYLETMPMIRLLTAATILLAICGPVRGADKLTNVFPQGDFEVLDGTGNPTGWQMPGGPNVRIESAGDNHFLRVRVADPRQGKWASAWLTLDPNWKRLRLTCRMRAAKLALGEESWQNARVLLRLDGPDKGTTLSYAPAPALSVDSDWREFETEFDLPTGARFLLLAPGIYGPGGDMAVDDIVIIANPPRRDPEQTRPGPRPILPGFPEGTFEQTDLRGNPDGWTLPKDPHVQYLEEDGNHFVRLTNTMIGAKFAIPGDWSKLTMSARFRAKDLKPGENSWEDGRIQWLFEDAEGKMVGTWPKCPNVQEDHKEWVTRQITQPVPAGARVLSLRLGTQACKGTLDVDDITITAVVAGELPAGEEPQWGREPIEVLSSTRSRVCLNGLWHFVPAVGPAAEDPQEGWGWIRVPGSWNGNWAMPGIVSRGSGTAWLGFDGGKLAKAWYERQVTIPADWAGRAVLLDLRRVSTDATVTVNGKQCGTVAWPYGQVDITNAVTPGQAAAIRLLVVATQDPGKVQVFMGPNQVHEVEADLKTRGIIGDVLLLSRPAGPRVSDVFVQTSVRKKRLTLDVELEDIPAPATAELVADVSEFGSGHVVRTFRQPIALQQAERQTVTASWSWPDPKLWDFLKPNLYMLKLRVQGGGVADEYPQRFGFREFWIDGRRFFLNGTEFRLRPNQGEPYYLGGDELIDDYIDGFIYVGYNIQELWPWDHDKRGVAEFRERWCDRADLTGWPMIAPALSMVKYLSTWNKPYREGAALTGKQYWEPRMLAEMKRYRNHPSVLIWGTSANRFGHRDDQNPRRIGQSAVPNDADYAALCAIGEEAVGTIKSHDPTRPVLVHQGAQVGDIYGLNNYLCMHPLQEREEWLSQWAKTGDMPYMAVEFGTPLNPTICRGRNGGALASATEPWMTEYCAIYQGAGAYQTETAAYRAECGQQQDKPATGWHACRYVDDEPALQALEVQFITNTWRSWRTWGVTGGMVPWSNAHGWDADIHGAQVDMGPFQPGSRGPYWAKLPNAWVHYLQPEGSTLRPAAHALLAVNHDTLAWIAGPDRANFTTKDHHAYCNSRFSKSVVLINDGRLPVGFHGTYSVELGGRQIGEGELHGNLDVAEIRFVPITVELPKVTARTDGSIRLSATMGKDHHEDRFAFRVYPKAPASSAGAVLIFDPEGETRRVIEGAGFIPRQWDGMPAPGAVLVVGRNALAGSVALPGSLDEYAQAGGRVVVFGHRPDWLAKNLGMRVSGHVSRRFWPVATMAEHPLLAGLDGEDFRDWNGRGSLVAEEEGTATGQGIRTSYGHGWHWGNRGSVASAAVEKPHCAGWKPLLEGEFDLAYSPLLELQTGKGLVILNLLDVEARGAVEPVAELLTRRVLAYAKSVDMVPRLPTVYVGGPRGERLLRQLRLRYDRASEVPTDASLLICGPEAQVDEAAMRRFMEAGGRALFLAPEGPSLPLGVTSEKHETFGGSIKVPDWPECAGLSVADMHFRLDRVPTRLFTSHQGADGLLARVPVAAGVAIFVGTLPDAMDENTNPYLRFSKWRLTRTIAQLIANMGGEFVADRKVFEFAPGELDPISLAGRWSFRAERKLIPAAADAPHQDTDKPAAWQAVELDLAGWTDFEAPAAWESLTDSYDGAVWFRREVSVPEDWAGRDLVLELGPIDDFDTTWFNGKPVGATGLETPSFYSHPRRYTVPGKLVKAGRNVIAVRVFDHFGSGGFTGQPSQMKLSGPSGNPIPLAGAWQSRVELRLEPAKNISAPCRDPGMKPACAEWAAVDLDGTGWDEVPVPGTIEANTFNFDGAAWFRRRLVVPACWSGQAARLSLGPVGNSARVWLNGRAVNKAVEGPGGWPEYHLAPGDLKPGTNTLAVRVFNAEGPGGFLGKPENMVLFVAGSAKVASFYVPGYRWDQELGDDPYRYYRW